VFLDDYTSAVSAVEIEKQKVVGNILVHLLDNDNVNKEIIISEECFALVFEVGEHEGKHRLRSGMSRALMTIRNDEAYEETPAYRSEGLSKEFFEYIGISNRLEHLVNKTIELTYTDSDKIAVKFNSYSVIRALMDKYGNIPRVRVTADLSQLYEAIIDLEMRGVLELGEIREKFRRDYNYVQKI